MVLEIIIYLNKCVDILKRLVVLVVVITLIYGNLNVCLMKVVIVLLHITTVLLQNEVNKSSKIRVKLNGSCLKQDKITFNHYEINKNHNISSFPTLENCLFGAVSLAKNMVNWM